MDDAPQPDHRQSSDMPTANPGFGTPSSPPVPPEHRESAGRDAVAGAALPDQSKAEAADWQRQVPGNPAGHLYQTGQRPSIQYPYGGYPTGQGMNVQGINGQGAGAGYPFAPQNVGQYPGAYRSGPDRPGPYRPAGYPAGQQYPAGQYSGGQHPGRQSPQRPHQPGPPGYPGQYSAGLRVDTPVINTPQVSIPAISILEVSITRGTPRPGFTRSCPKTGTPRLCPTARAPIRYRPPRIAN